MRLHQASSCAEERDSPRAATLSDHLEVPVAPGKLLGTRVHGLGAVTTLCPVAYFLVAIGAHLRARDFGRSLFVNATGMLVICVTVLWTCFIRRR